MFWSQNIWSLQIGGKTKQSKVNVRKQNTHALHDAHENSTILQALRESGATCQY